MAVSATPLPRQGAPRAPNDLEPYWMPFTANRQFKGAPRLLVGAKGLHYTTAEGRKVLDGTAGLWCCNAGHSHPKIVAAIQGQAAEMDYAPAFQMGHPKAFELAGRLAALAPGDLDHVFFVNSGSEAVDTALKIAHRLSPRSRRGRAHPPHRPRAGISRRRLRRHLGRRHLVNRKFFGSHAPRRRSPAADLRPREAGLLARPAGMGRASRRRARAHRRAARRLDHRRRHRRAGRRLDGRAGAAQGLSRSGCARSATSTAFS